MTMHIKFPRIYHIPSSPKKGCDDKVANTDYFRYLNGQEIVMTAKLDGGNTCVTMEGLVFARSHGQTTTDPSFDYLKSQVPKWVDTLTKRELDMYGENLYHVHTIQYLTLPSWFFVIGFRHRPSGIWLPWDEVMLISHLLQIPTVPVLYRGVFTDQSLFEQKIIACSKQSQYNEKHPEGVVVRKTSAFIDQIFNSSVFKWVSNQFIIDGDHWQKKERIVASLAKNKKN